jgi:pyruvate dehydrogenase E1 component beta subunit
VTTTIVTALRQALAAEMQNDPSVFVMGEDVGIGGSFHLTLGLLERFGADRVRDTPVSEAGFVGLAIGAALAGMRPVVDFQYGDFLLPAADQVIQQATKLPYMSGGQVSVPIVLHAPTGASGRGAQHANAIENVFFGVPGLRLAVPATAYDAKGMMTTAIRSDVPTLIVSQKYLYGSKGRRLERGAGVVDDGVPLEPYEVPVGAAQVRRAGRDLTIVAALLMVHRALEAADALEELGIFAEVIDLRWLSPMDHDSVVESVTRTGRLLVVEEGPGHGGWGAAVAACVADRALGHLDAPIRRLSGPDRPLPFAPHLEQQLVPNTTRIFEAARALMGGA